MRNGKRQILNVILPGDIVGLPGSFYERAVYSVTAITDLRMNVCSLDAYVQLCYRHPQYGLALTWIAVQEATTYAEHVIDVGRRTPVERLSHFLLELHARLKAVGRAEKARFTLPFSQEVIADVLGLSVPHLNRMMQQLRSEKLIADTRARGRIPRRRRACRRSPITSRRRWRRSRRRRKWREPSGRPRERETRALFAATYALPRIDHPLMTPRACLH